MAYAKITPQVEWIEADSLNTSYFNKLDIEIILNQEKAKGGSTSHATAGSTRIKFARMTEVKSDNSLEQRECFVLVAVAEGDSSGSLKTLDSPGNLMALPCPPFVDRIGNKEIKIQ